MTIKELYCYERETGKITVSTEKPESNYSLRYRLIADEKKLLTNDGENFTPCIDVESTEGYYEVDEVVQLLRKRDENLSKDNQIIYMY